MRRSAVFRGWAVVWAVLQFALPFVVTFADARLERESARAPGAHIEETAGATCRPEHPDECALCQFLSHGATPEPAAALPVIAGHLRACAQAPLHGAVSSTRDRVALPRAPPHALV